MIVDVFREPREIRPVNKIFKGHEHRGDGGGEVEEAEEDGQRNENNENDRTDWRSSPLLRRDLHTIGRFELHR